MFFSFILLRTLASVLFCFRQTVRFVLLFLFCFSVQFCLYFLLLTYSRMFPFSEHDGAYASYTPLLKDEEAITEDFMGKKTCSLVKISSVQDSIYALGKAHMRSTPSLRSFLNVAFETVPMFV